MEEAVPNKLRKQQHTERRLGYKTGPQAPASKLIIQQTKGVVRHFLPPRTKSPKSLHEQLRRLRELARKNRQHSQDRPITEQSGESPRILPSILFRKPRFELQCHNRRRRSTAYMQTSLLRESMVDS